MILRRTVGVLILTLLAGTGWANTIDALALELRGPDEAARVHARQMLPREGVDALPAVLPLINDESEPVWRAAYNVVADIANQACAPGHESDRARATDLLMGWIAPNQTPRAQEYGLRLIRYIVPPGYSVDAIVPFLQLNDLREYARGALEIIGSNEARLALEAAMAGADPEFKTALLDSLRHLASVASLPVLSRAMDDPDPFVRASAARAAASFADPTMAPRYRQLPVGVTPETMFYAMDAVLRYADALARAGGNWTLAMSTYIEILASVDDPVLISGAMMGLGRYGDEHVVPVLIEKAGTSPSREVQGALPLALAALHGRAATEAIVAHYDALPEALRPAVLRALGDTPRPDVVALVQKELGNADPAYRVAAVSVASELGSLELLAPLMTLIEQSNDVERAAALDAALAITRAGAQGNTAPEAGAALIRLYPFAQDDSTRFEILSALSKNPVVHALPLAMEAVKTPALAPAAVPVLVALVQPLMADGKKDQAHEAFAAVMAASGSATDVVAMAADLGASADELGLPKMLGAVHAWHVMGPFAWQDDSGWDRAFVNEPNVDLAATIDNKKWNDVATADSFGIVDLTQQLGQQSHVFAYAYTTIDVPAGGDAQLRLGSDDGIVAWVNGEKVWENRVDRGLAVDSDVAPIRLREGSNAVLLKISQGGGGWNFCCRVTDTSGMGIPRS